MKATSVDAILPPCRLAEGPHWDAPTGSLIWVDIDGGAIHRLDPASGTVLTLSLAHKVCFAVPDSDRSVIAGLDRTIARVALDTGQVEILAELPAQAGAVRFNDGKCDADGRLWAGTMPLDRNSGTPGRLYSWDGRNFREQDGPFALANGKDWSPDGSILYHADTEARTVWAYDVKPGSADLGNRREFATLDGRPDGLCVSGAGHVLVAIYGGSRVEIHDSSGGKAGIIDVPAPNVTSCAFGGEARDELYITTAENDAGPGSLYRCRPGMTGQTMHRFAPARS